MSSLQHICFVDSEILPSCHYTRDIYVSDCTLYNVRLIVILYY